MVTSYDAFVFSELPQAVARYHTGHGHLPSTSDLAHLAWQRLVEEREYENWLQAAERKDLPGDPPFLREPASIHVPSLPGPDTRPTRDQIRSWSGDFLDALNNFNAPTFMLPGMPPDLQQLLISRYPGSHVPCGWKTFYPKFPQWRFDHTGNFAAYELTLDMCLRGGCIPVVAIPIEAGDSLTTHLTRIEPFLDRLLKGDRLLALMWGWEINDINDWTADGDMQLEYLVQLRRRIGGEPLLYAHWTPERWSGWPSFRNTVGNPEDEGGELQWLRQARAAASLDGVCYQEPFDKPLDELVERTFRIDKKNYDGPGICGRIQTAGVDFVLFEHSRDPEHYHAVVRAVTADGRAQGFC